MDIICSLKDITKKKVRKFESLFDKNILKYFEFSLAINLLSYTYCSVTFGDLQLIHQRGTWETSVG